MERRLFVIILMPNQMASLSVRNLLSDHALGFQPERAISSMSVMSDLTILLAYRNHIIPG
jgi:hypothetical protein